MPDNKLESKPDNKLTLTMNQESKNKLRQLGELMLEMGYKVKDPRRGGVSLSEVIRVLVDEKLQKLEEKTED